MTATIVRLGLNEAIDKIMLGLCVAYPTETFYGFGVDATNSKAVQSLYELKGREPNKPFPILLPNSEALSQYVERIPLDAIKLIEKFWPGALTIVLKSSKFQPPIASATGAVGFRVSSHSIAENIFKNLKVPITSTSANYSGQPPCTTLDQLAFQFPGKTLFALDAGPTPGKTPSTVISFETNDWMILREGAISKLNIEQALGKPNG